jgi:predicted outer membrane repeat protein
MTFRNGLASPQGSQTLGGAIQNGATLTVSGCIIENSDATRGGGLFSSGPLTLQNTTVQTNTAEYGGGISTSGPFMNLRNCTVRDNHSGFGGGILAFDQGFFPAVLSLSDCIVEDNDAASGGGVFFSSNSGELTVLRTTIRHNHAATTAGVGGGLYSGGVATTRVHDSLLEANSADFGGGIYDEFSHTLAVVNSTLSSNTANTNGGGIYSAGLTLFANVSVVNNDADHDRDENGGVGGGIYVSSGAFLLQNSLVAANTIVNAPIFDDCKGIVMTSGKNLLGETDGCTFGGSGAGAVGSVSLGTIGPLQDNGGPTLTHALTAGSEAIDATHDGFACIDENGAVLSTDQRGASRIAGTRCDVGAFEFASSFDRILTDGFD